MTDISYKSDHSLILFKLCFSKTEHGTGVRYYVNCINNKIDEVIPQYCLPVYDLDNVLLLDTADLQFSNNDQSFLETSSCKCTLRLFKMFNLLI